MVARRVFCTMCNKEVSAGHRTPEALWLHRTVLILDGAQNKPNFIRSDEMPKAKSKAAAKKAVARSTKVPAKAAGKAAATKETAAERKLREAEEKKLDKVARR
jgi:hypothetical protein